MQVLQSHSSDPTLSQKQADSMPVDTPPDAATARPTRRVLDALQAGEAEGRATVEAWRPTAFLDVLLRDALLQAHTGNLYEHGGSHLASFTRMADFTVLRDATESGTACLAAALAGADQPCIVDLGAGPGRELCALLQRLEVKSGAVVTVVPTDLNAEALLECEARLQEIAARRSICLRVTPIVGALQDAATWHSIKAAIPPSATTAAFATLALHHLADACKTPVLARVAELQPKVFVLTEVECNGCSPALADRFAEAVEMYGAVFACMDQDLGECDDLKRAFFGTELKSFLGNDNYERFEVMSSWVLRCSHAGMTAVSTSTVGFKGKALVSQTCFTSTAK